jgi:hypothetical protein
VKEPIADNLLEHSQITCQHHEKRQMLEEGEGKVIEKDYHHITNDITLAASEIRVMRDICSVSPTPYERVQGGNHDKKKEEMCEAKTT